MNPNLFITITLNGKQINHAAEVDIPDDETLETILEGASLAAEQYIENRFNKGLWKMPKEVRSG